jgi:predicted lipoprotein
MNVIKSLVLVGILCITTAFANVNDANDERENKEILNTLYEKVIIKDINSALKDIKSLKQAVTKKDIKKSKEDFAKLVNSWKSVETFYLLGDINEDFIDTPRYIDIFHNGNEDITEQLDRAIKSKDELRIVLFKNSLKSINALEYMLFVKDIKNTRENKITLTILNKITSHLADIKDEYIAKKQNYLKDLKKANALTINAIIQNTYKLKEWRVGDVAGFTKKYEDDPDNKRAEYFLSKNSANAIQAVLNTYKNVLDNKAFIDYGDYLIRLTDGKEMKKLRDSLNKSLLLVKEIKNDDFSNARELYENINTIHVVLFVEMLEELSINAKILDADGD